MKNQLSFSGTVRTLSVALLVGLSPSMSAQTQSERTRRTRSPLTIVAVKGLGKVRTPQGSLRVPDEQQFVPPLLQADEVKTAIKAATGKDLTPENDPGLTLGPRNPWVPDKGYLLIGGPSFYNPVSGHWYVYAEPANSTSSPAIFGIEFNANAGPSHVVDFVLSSTLPTDLKCYMPDGSTRKQPLSKSKLQHVLFLIEAGSKGWQRLGCELPNGSGLQVDVSSVRVAPWK